MVYILCGEFAGFEQALLSDIRQNVFRERFILKLLFMHEARRREGKIASERECQTGWIFGQKQAKHNVFYRRILLN